MRTHQPSIKIRVIISFLLIFGLLSSFSGYYGHSAQADSTQGKLQGTVYSLGYCDANPAPLANALVVITTSGGATVNLQTDANGYYSYWFDEADSPLSITVTAVDHAAGSTTGVSITAGQTTVQDFDLRWLKPCVNVTPTEISATVEWQQSAIQKMTLANSGAADMTFNITEMSDQSIPMDVDWLSESPLEGTLAADTGTQVVDVTLDSAAASVVQPGTYKAQLKIQTNDPNNGTISIPVTMAVNPSARPVPTLSEWGILAMITALGASILLVLRRKMGNRTA